MLEKLNSKIQGWFAWLIISLIAFTFAIFGIEHYMQSRSANMAKAEVNGKAILMHDFDIQYRRQQRMNAQAEMSVAREREFKRELEEHLIKQSAMLQSAEKNGFYVSDSQASAQIQAIPQFQEEGHFSLGRYQQALSNALFSPETFITEIKEEMLLNQQRFAFSGTAFALPYELDQFLKLFNQTRDFDYLIIPAQLFVGSVHVDDQAIKAYYQAHQDKFKTPEQVGIAYVQLSMQEIRNKTRVSNELIQQYYEDNKANYVTPASWKVAHILFAVSPQGDIAEQKKVEEKANQTYTLLKKSPEQFAALAKTVSDDKLSAMKAGELPVIIAGQSEFDKSLLDLTTPGQLSKPVKTTHGFEIFKLIAYTPSKTQPFESVKTAIQSQLVSDEVQTRYAKALEQIADLAYQSPDTLEPIAQALNLPIKKTEMFPQSGGQTNITQQKQVLASAFSHDVLSLGNNSEPIQVDNDSVIVLRLLKHLPAAERPLAEVKPEIKQLLTQQLAQAEAKNLGERLLLLQANSAEAQKLLALHHLTWKDVHQAKRNDQALPKDINHFAFGMSQIGETSGRSIGRGDFVLVKLKNIADGNPKSVSEEQRGAITQNMETTFGVTDYSLYQANQLKEASIVRF